MGSGQQNKGTFEGKRGQKKISGVIKRRIPGEWANRYASWLIWLTIGLVLSGCVSKARVAILQLDVGGHKDLIRDVLVTGDGKYLVSASTDKTIRVWDSQTYTEVRKILGQIGSGMEGKIYAIALSPDEKMLAVGGYLAGTRSEMAGIRLYDFRSGLLLQNLKSHTNVVNDLDFSEDGQTLVSGSADKTVKVWRKQEGRFRLFKTFREHKRTVNAVRVFRHHGEMRVVSASYDDKVRLYSLARGLLNAYNRHSEAKSLAVSDHFIAASGTRDRKIHLFDHDLNLVHTIDSDTFPIELAFSPDGRWLAAGAGSFPMNCNLYDTFTWEKKTSFRKHNNTVNAVAFLNNQTVISGGGENHEFYFWDARTAEVKGKIVGQGKSVWSVGLKGQKMAWGNIGERPRVLWQSKGRLEKSFDLEKMVILTGAKAAIDSRHFQRVSQEWKDYVLTHSQGEDNKLPDAVLEIRQHGRTLAKVTRRSWDGYRHRVYGFTEAGTILSGGNHGYLKAYNLKGHEIASFIGHTGEVFSLAVEGDRLVSGSMDQTINIWNLKELKTKAEIYPLVTLFVSSDGEWVMWTKEGFFNASEKGARFIGYHLNRGPEKEADYVSVDRLYNLFYRPDLVERALNGEDVSNYAQHIDINRILGEGMPPSVEFLTESGASKSRDVELSIRICDQGGGVGQVTLFLNNMAVTVSEGSRGIKLLREDSATRTERICYESKHLISLVPGNNSISMVAFNQDGTVESQRPVINLTHRAHGVGNPDLHMMAIAVDRYRDGDLHLKFSRNDAKAMLSSLSKVGKRLFRDIHFYTLYDDDVHKDHIARLFDRVGQQARPEDVFILYMAGHGVTSRKDGNYYYLPVNFRYTGEDTIQKQGISNAFFLQNLSKVKSQKSLVLLDTCNSGSFTDIRTRGVEEKTAVSRLVRATGRATLMASSKTQVALEGYNNHGVFTWIMLEALGGKGFGGDHQITVNELADYVETELPELTYKKFGYEQVPQKTLQGMNFPLGLK